MKRYVPKRGDIVWLQFDPQAGHEQKGHRPALVLSPALYNEKAGLALCCPVTSAIKGYPFEVPLPEGDVVSGAVLADQVRSVDWRARRARFAAELPPALVADVAAKVRVLVDG